MRLNLSLNGWPPLASHVLALLFGVSLAHLSWQPEAEPLKLAGRSLALSLPSSLLAKTGGRTIKQGHQIHLLHSEPGHAPCRLSFAPWLLLVREPTPVASAKLAAAGELPAIAKAATGNLLELRDARLGSVVPPCAARPKVIYGPP